MVRRRALPQGQTNVVDGDAFPTGSPKSIRLSPATSSCPHTLDWPRESPFISPGKYFDQRAGHFRSPRTRVAAAPRLQTCAEATSLPPDNELTHLEPFYFSQEVLTGPR